MTEKEKLIKWLYNHDKYELLWKENFTNKQLIETIKIIKKLDKIIEEMAQKFNKSKINKKLWTKKLELGITTTKEAIINELYSAIY